MSDKLSPWKPSTLALAIKLPKKGSSPAPSITLPHLASLEISTIGAKVQFNPSALASRAAVLAVFLIKSISHVQDSANGIGKIVLYP